MSTIKACRGMREAVCMVFRMFKYRSACRSDYIHSLKPCHGGFYMIVLKGTLTGKNLVI